MYIHIYQFWLQLPLNAFFLKAAQPITMCLYLLLLTLISILLRFVVKVGLSFFLEHFPLKKIASWSLAMQEKKLPSRLANLSIPLVLSIAAEEVLSSGEMSAYLFLFKLAGLVLMVTLIMLFNTIIALINTIYDSYEISKLHPIKGMLQVIQVVLFIACIIAAFAILLGQNPLYMVGGIGALAAVISFIFKDPILGFVAGVQLTANNMIRIGDHIEMPHQSLHGDVVEVSMTTVKVQSFDHTLALIPAQALVNNPFVNWSGMQEAGGRRIKRSIYINAATVCLCSDEMIQKFQQIDLLKDYITKKLIEIQEDNAKRSESASQNILNTRQLTNLGTFRAYMQAYLTAHPGIHHEMTTMVRQLAPDAKGIPLEVYAFTNTTEWERYEQIQADIFDHFFSSVASFGLEVYQSPSGSDLRSLHMPSDISSPLP